MGELDTVNKKISDENKWKSYITAKTAILAKDKGYDEYCTDCYCQPAKYEDEENESGHLIVVDGEPFDSWTGLIPDYSLFLAYRPTQAELQKWLHDVKNMFVSVNKSIKVGTSNHYVYFFNVFGLMHEMISVDTFEEALELGLQEALNNI